MWSNIHLEMFAGDLVSQHPSRSFCCDLTKAVSTCERGLGPTGLLSNSHLELARGFLVQHHTRGFGRACREISAGLMAHHQSRDFCGTSEKPNINFEISVVIWPNINRGGSVGAPRSPISTPRSPRGFGPASISKSQQRFLAQHQSRRFCESINFSISAGCAQHQSQNLCGDFWLCGDSGSASITKSLRGFLALREFLEQQQFQSLCWLRLVWVSRSFCGAIDQ